MAQPIVGTCSCIICVSDGVVESTDHWQHCAWMAGNYKSKVLLETKESGGIGETTMLPLRDHPSQRKFFRGKFEHLVTQNLYDFISYHGVNRWIPSESKSWIPYVLHQARLWQLLQGQGWRRLLIAVLWWCRRNRTIRRLASARRNESRRFVVVLRFQCWATSRRPSHSRSAAFFFSPPPPAALKWNRPGGRRVQREAGHQWTRRY
jgi:hypothetical protein